MESVNLLVWLAKLSLYLATAGVIGGYFMWMLSPAAQAASCWFRYYRLSAALLGLGSVLLAFTLQLLQFSGQGWASFYDWELYALLLDTKQGLSWALAAAGFSLYAVSLVLCRPGLVQHSTWCIACLSILLSFVFSGHLVNSPWYGRLALLLHVLAMSLWLGALLPLWRINQSTDTARVTSVMQRFGFLAVSIVSLLVLAGALMLWLLLDDLYQLWQTAYGQSLLLKLALVLLLLLLAAVNKFRLVPQLAQPGRGKHLSVTIRLEMVVSILILMMTAVATVIIGLSRI